MSYARVFRLAVVMSSLSLSSCGDDDKQTIPDYCDPIVPEFCAFPFPSNRWLVDDPSLPSGKRVEIDPRTMPVSDDGTVTQTYPFQLSDGFSPGGEFITYLPGMTIAGLADPEHIERSLEADSPTVIIDEATGEHIPHWAELDMRSKREGERALLIRPAVRLKDAHTYIIAVRAIADQSGSVIPASPAFAALRDNGRFPHPSIRARRARYEEIFAKLESAGVERGSIQLAWDVSTSSQENQSSRMLHIRDAGLAALGNAVPTFVIDDVIDAPQAHIARRINGHVTVPLFLDSPALGGEAVLDEHGMPTQNGTASFAFSVIVTDNAVTGATDPIIQYGHGLFGTQEDIMRGELASLANSMGAVCVAVDWLGMTTDDAARLAALVLKGDLHHFATVPDRGQQAMLNAMYALRVVELGLPTDPSMTIGGNPIFSPGAKYFVGNSLGGIYGSTYISLSPDIDRAALFVPGVPFSLLLPRSEAYDTFKKFLDKSFGTDMRMHPFMMSLLQMLWDRVEPTGFANHILHDPFPGSSSPDVIVFDAIGDPVVTTKGGRLFARTLGLTSLSPANRPVFGVPVADGPLTRSAFLEVSFGLPPEPLTNVSVPQSPNPHDMPFQNEGIRNIARAFLETGIATNTCSGPCDPN